MNLEAHSFTACSNKAVNSFQFKNAVKMVKSEYLTGLKIDDSVNIKQIIVVCADVVYNKSRVSV